MESEKTTVCRFVYVATHTALSISYHKYYTETERGNEVDQITQEKSIARLYNKDSFTVNESNQNIANIL